MKTGQLIGIAVAGIAGLGAFVLMQGIVNQPVKENTVEVKVDATEVLVAAGPIDLGAIANDSLFRWQTCRTRGCRGPRACCCRRTK